MDIKCLDNRGCTDSIFIIDTPSLNSNANNDIMLSNGNKSRINIECNGIRSCEKSIISVTGVDYFQLNCDGKHSCRRMHLSVSSLNINETSGKLVLNCNAAHSCNTAYINGLSLRYLTINCVNKVDSCGFMEVSLFYVFELIYIILANNILIYI